MPIPDKEFGLPVLTRFRIELTNYRYAAPGNIQPKRPSEEPIRLLRNAKQESFRFYSEKGRDKSIGRNALSICSMSNADVNSQIS
ncbi:hypothetical protein CEXT_772951 [Caerostris extrusa]|uniref:Uncharacterized protein n=1 Tax=Caerostris extrusa TaxID=172846 RepID=A0AAV4UBP9_CAEEX|nr:hypothetical protein CEXT_772951 [Caerostris extrusa]